MTGKNGTNGEHVAINIQTSGLGAERRKPGPYLVILRFRRRTKDDDRKEKTTASQQIANTTLLMRHAQEHGGGKKWVLIRYEKVQMEWETKKETGEVRGALHISHS